MCVRGMVVHEWRGALVCNEVVGVYVGYIFKCYITYVLLTQKRGFKLCVEQNVLFPGLASTIMNPFVNVSVI